MRIVKFFPDTTITPVVVKRKTHISQEEKDIAQIIGNLTDKKILVIASVDFSHHVREEIAEIHDVFAVEVLKNRSPWEWKNLEVDCRNCLAIAKFLAEEKGKNDFNFALRTSVDSVMGTYSDLENTSHIFGKFSKSSIRQESKRFLIYLPDFSINANIGNIEKNFYNRYDESKNPKFFYHRIFSGVDEIIMVAENGKIGNSENFSRFQKFGITKYISKEELAEKIKIPENFFEQKSSHKISFLFCQE